MKFNKDAEAVASLNDALMICELHYNDYSKENTYTLIIKSFSLYSSKNYQLSIESVDKYIKLQPNLASGYFWKAQNLFKLLYFEEAAK